MAKIGKISTIKREPNSSIQTMESSLSQRGYTRIPGATVLKFPYKEMDGLYRTGLDPNAGYIKRIKDDTERELEIERVTTLKKKLEQRLNVDLSPTSEFWNYRFSRGTDDNKHVKPVQLKDGDNFFHLNNVWEELAFAWLRVHPTIASSYQAWQRGEYPADTQYYVVDEEIESKLAYDRKQLINKAIIKFDSMTPTKKKKIARQLGIHVTEDTLDEQVYVLVDNVLKQTDFKEGKFKGLNPVKVFHQFADMSEQLLTVKDIVKQAITHSVLRIEKGKLFKGSYEISKNEDDYVKYLMQDENQEDLIALEEELKSKKLLSV